MESIGCRIENRLVSKIVLVRIGAGVLVGVSVDVGEAKR
jgi:hypothetical protein